MKYRLSLAKPTNANRALVPALCASALALSFVLQLALTGAVEMPDESWSGGHPSAKMPSIAGQFVPPILLQRPVFSPGRTATSVADQAVQAPLGGAVVAGTVSVRGRSYAVVQRPDGVIRRLAVGGRYAGWRLRSLSSTGAVFDRGAQRLALVFGVAPAQTATQMAENEEEQ